MDAQLVQLSLVIFVFCMIIVINVFICHICQKRKSNADFLYSNPPAEMAKHKTHDSYSHKKVLIHGLEGSNDALTLTSNIRLSTCGESCGRRYTPTYNYKEHNGLRMIEPTNTYSSTLRTPDPNSSNGSRKLSIQKGSRSIESLWLEIVDMQGDNVYAEILKNNTEKNGCRDPDAIDWSSNETDVKLKQGEDTLARQKTDALADVVLCASPIKRALLEPRASLEPLNATESHETTWTVSAPDEGSEAAYYLSESESTSHNTNTGNRSSTTYIEFAKNPVHTTPNAISINNRKLMSMEDFPTPIVPGNDNPTSEIVETSAARKEGQSLAVDFSLQLSHHISRLRSDISDSEIDFKDGMQLVGTGKFGRIYLGKYNDANVAFKQVPPVSSLNETRECDKFSKITMHPFICRMYGVYKNFIVMEYIPDGSVYDCMIKRNHPFSRNNKLQMCIQTASAVSFLHRKNLIHADLALRNVLIDIQNMRTALTDFGLSKFHPTTEQVDIVSPRWASPELMQTRVVSFQSDIWALACVFGEIWQDGKKPYDHLLTSYVVKHLMNNGSPPEIGSNWPESVRTIMAKMFNFTVDAKLVSKHFQYHHGEEFGDTPL